MKELEQLKQEFEHLIELVKGYKYKDVKKFADWISQQETRLSHWNIERGDEEEAKRFSRALHKKIFGEDPNPDETNNQVTDHITNSPNGSNDPIGL